MALRTLLIKVDEKTFDDLHKLMGFSIQDENNITVYRLFEGRSKQQWYREIITAGIQRKLEEFQMMKKRLEKDED